MVNHSVINLIYNIAARDNKRHTAYKTTDNSSANIQSATTGIKVSTASASLSSEHTNIKAQDISGKNAGTEHLILHSALMIRD